MWQMRQRHAEQLAKRNGAITMQSYESLKAEIDDFKSVWAHCNGSRYPWVHFPQRVTDGITKKMHIRCGCGKDFDGRDWLVPSDQPAPILWESFQQFKAHIKEVQNPEPELCGDCDGCGWVEGGETLKTTCSTCKGTGVKP